MMVVGARVACFEYFKRCRFSQLPTCTYIESDHGQLRYESKIQRAPRECEKPQILKTEYAENQKWKMLKSENVENGNLYIYIIDKFGRMVLYSDRQLMFGAVLVLVMIWMSELQVIGKRVLGVD